MGHLRRTLGIVYSYYLFQLGDITIKDGRNKEITMISFFQAAETRMFYYTCKIFTYRLRFLQAMQSRSSSRGRVDTTPPDGTHPGQRLG